VQHKCANTLTYMPKMITDRCLCSNVQKRTYLNDFICPLEGSFERGKGRDQKSALRSDAVSPIISLSHDEAELDTSEIA